ncbi:hypothetical protein LXL04_037398 [Taraxacum kok-saghyz]
MKKHADTCEISFRVLTHLLLASLLRRSGYIIRHHRSPHLISAVVVGVHTPQTTNHHCCSSSKGEGCCNRRRFLFEVQDTPSAPPFRVFASQPTDFQFEITPMFDIVKSMQAIPSRAVSGFWVWWLFLALLDDFTLLRVAAFSCAGLVAAAVWSNFWSTAVILDVLGCGLVLVFVLLSCGLIQLCTRIQSDRTPAFHLDRTHSPSSAPRMLSQRISQARLLQFPLHAFSPKRPPSQTPYLPPPSTHTSIFIAKRKMAPSSNFPLHIYPPVQRHISQTPPSASLDPTSPTLLAAISHRLPVKPPLAGDRRTPQLHRRPLTSQLQVRFSSIFFWVSFIFFFCCRSSFFYLLSIIPFLFGCMEESRKKVNHDPYGWDSYNDSKKPKQINKITRLTALRKEITGRSVFRNETIFRIKLSPAHRAGTPLYIAICWFMKNGFGECGI